MTSHDTLILGSASPRRRELLDRIGIVPALVVAPDIDESPLKGEKPIAYVKRMALEKLHHVTALHPGTAVLTADSTITLGRRILGKPRTPSEARNMLQLLSGRRHKSLTAVAFYDPHHGVPRCRVVTTVVKFKRLSPGELSAYVASGEWQDRAGGYAIGHSADRFIEWLRGSPTSVMGLPLCETANLLYQARK